MTPTLTPHPLLKALAMPQASRDRQLDAALAAETKAIEPKSEPKATYPDLYNVFDDDSACCQSKNGGEYQLVVRYDAAHVASVHHIAADERDLYPTERECEAAGHGRPCRHRRDLAALLNHPIINGWTLHKIALTVEAEILEERCFCGGTVAAVTMAGRLGRPWSYRVCLSARCGLTAPVATRRAV